MSTDKFALFPLGIATGAAFCNRDEERKLLMNNVLSGTHTWIMGRRRHGKTSLVSQVMEELDRRKRPRIEHEGVDLLVVHNLQSLDEVLRNAVGALSGRLLPANRRVLGYLEQAFAAFKPELTLASDGVKVRLFSGAASAPRIEEMLAGLDRAARHFKRRAVLVIDEFQQLARLDEGHAIEGAIRSVAQRAEALSFVFLGSEKSLLAEMFEHPDRPLYHLCHKLEIERIDAADYAEFLGAAARMRWNGDLDADTVRAILDQTLRHPYYVNALCRLLWQRKKRPDPQAVADQWAIMYEQERHRVTTVLLNLTTNQRALLHGLARYPTESPTAQAFLGRVGLSSASVVVALEALESRDFVRRDPSRTYVLIDPLLAEYLSQVSAAP